MILRSLVLAMLAAVAGPALAQTAPSACPAVGARGPGALHRSWILEGWQLRPVDPTFSFRDKFGRFYDWSGRDVLLFDDFDPERRAVRSAAAYGAIWEPIFRANRSALHVVSDGPDVAMGTGGLAASSLEFVARIETRAGKVTGLRTRSDTVWRCRAEGWRIVREHNSSKIIPVAEAERALAARSGEPK